MFAISQFSSNVRLKYWHETLAIVYRMSPDIICVVNIELLLNRLVSMIWL
jgi:hypothetical protein